MVFCPSLHSRARTLGGSALAVAVFLLGHGTAYAKDEGESRTELADPARDQLDADLTVVPDGYGSLFVPTLEAESDPEASVIVELDGETLAVGRLGQRIPLPPGHYRALVLRVGRPVTEQKDRDGQRATPEGPSS